MTKFNLARDPMQEYEVLLEQRYPDLPDGWDLYENTTEVRQGFELGLTARQIFEARHGDF